MLDELALLSLLLTAVALISCLSVEEKRWIRALPRWAWLVTILVVPLAGGAGWFVLGRPRRPGPRRLARGRPAQVRGPDDDPDFLRSVDT